MSLEIIIPIAVGIILLLLFIWLVTLLKSTVKTVLAIAAILILLQVAFDINSEQIIQQVVQILEGIRDFAIDKLGS